MGRKSRLKKERRIEIQRRLMRFGRILQVITHRLFNIKFYELKPIERINIRLYQGRYKENAKRYYEYIKRKI